MSNTTANTVAETLIDRFNVRGKVGEMHIRSAIDDVLNLKEEQVLTKKEAFFIISSCNFHEGNDFEVNLFCKLKAIKEGK